MKSSKIDYLLVGVFVLAMLGGLIVSLALLTGRTGAVDGYHLVLRNVTGIKFGTQVLYEGFPIGQVEEVTPQAAEGGMTFRIDLSVREGWKIPDDSTAQVAASSLLAAVSVNIAAGDSPTALTPGSAIPSKEAANIFSVMSDVAGEITELSETSLKPLLDNLNRTVQSFGQLLEGDAGNLVREVRTLTLDLAQRVPVIAANIEEFTHELNQVGDQMTAVATPANVKKIQNAIESLTGATQNIDRLTNDLNITLARLDSALETTNGLLADTGGDIRVSVGDMRHVAASLARHVDSINQNMEGAARNMYEFSRQIRQNPGLLLGGTAPRDDAER